MRRLPLISLLLVATTSFAPALAKDDKRAPSQSTEKQQAISDVLKAPRPEGGEFFGLYLLGKKVGYIQTDLTFAPGDRSKAIAKNEFVFKANVGTKVSEQRITEERVYESKPGGKLLSFKIAKTGDGGAQTLIGTATSSGLRVLRKRPGLPHQIVNQPASRETVEDADQARVALLRGEAIEGTIVDGQDLEQYLVRTTLGGTEERVIAGVHVKLRKATTVSAKEKVPIDAFITEEGRVFEIQFGATMKALAETPEVARRLDVVDVFRLTRVELPHRPDLSKGELTLVVSGLDEKFHKASARQSFKKLKNGHVEVTLRKIAPGAGKRPSLPLKDPGGGSYLKSTMAVEADHPELAALARKIVGKEKDPYAAAKAIALFVSQYVVDDYGASSDRATDVLAKKRGDCTEHSLLAVSMMRAAGIPARRIDGVAYVDNGNGVHALYWHEWVEAWTGVEWIQLDPTFGQSVADAAHFAVGEEGSAEITPLIGALKVHALR